MINLLFSGNDKVFDGVVTCLLSILKRSKFDKDSDDYLNVYIMTMDVSHIKDTYTPISDKQIAFLDNVVKKYDNRHKVSKIDVTNHYMQEFSNCPNENCYCSPYTLLRLFADYCNLPSKVLYLDIDIMFNRDIHLLYDIDIEGYEYAASNDHYGKYLIKPTYINAGVILFNMKTSIENGLFEKARNLIKVKKLAFADQSAIIRSTTSFKLLKQRFNDQKYLHPHTVVRHFSKRLFYLPYPHTENIKQYHVDRVHKVFKYHQFDDCFNEYLELKKQYEMK